MAAAALTCQHKNCRNLPASREHWGAYALLPGSFPCALQGGQPSAWHSRHSLQAHQLRDVAWLAPAVASEAISGRGLKCWLTVPPSHLAGLLPLVTSLPPPQLLGAPGPVGAAGGGSGTARAEAVRHEGAVSEAGTAGDTASDTSSSESSVEVRVCIGNRRLMQEEGVALSPEVTHCWAAIC